MTDDRSGDGQRLMREGERVLRRDARSALADGDFNMVVRRAQEAVELTLKGALATLGIEYPKVHDVAALFSRQLRQKRGAQDEATLGRMEGISLWLSEARAPSFYLERDYVETDATNAMRDAEYVVATIGQLLGDAGPQARRAI